MGLNFGSAQVEFLKEKSYLLGDETVEERINAIVDVVRGYESKYSDGLADRIKYLIENKIFCPSTPQWANVGRKKLGNTSPLPCSCNIITVPNSIAGIYYSISETAMLSKLGAGVGADFSGVAEENTYLSEGFYTNSKLDWGEDLIRASQKVSQGATRRGYSVYFDSILSKDLPKLLERIDKRNPFQKDPFIDNNVGIYIPKGFIEEVRLGNIEYQKLFLKVLKIRKDTGKVYLVFDENMNKNQSLVYKRLNHRVVATNICTEVVTPRYDDKTFSCIIASLNLIHWDLIKSDKQIIKDCYMFLDIMVEEYIRLTEGVPFLEKARKSAIEKRDIGIGTLGFHDYIQSKGYAFGDIGSRLLNKEIYATIRDVCDNVNIELAEKLGACKMALEAELNWRNVSQMMVAPNKTTSFLAGDPIESPSGVSLGIEPIMSNYNIKALAGIQEVYKNPRLIKLLESRGKNDADTWESILYNLGSVQHLTFLTKEEKDIYKTFSEISPKDIIDLAADRQVYIDMAQSINLVSRPNYTMKDIYDIHMYAYDRGIKTLYYLYNQAHASMEKNGESWDACASCAD